MKYKLLFFFLILVVPKAECYVGNNRIHFEFKGINDGLAASTIECIYEDCRGFIWLGTQNGLSRYDGYSFRRYYHKRNDTTALSENYINAITGGENGDLWVCAYSGGVSVYDQKTDRFHTLMKKDDDPNSLIDNRTVCILYSSHKHFWIGTENGLSDYDPAKKRFTNYAYCPTGSVQPYQVKTICEDAAGNIWVGTEKGELFIYDAAGNVSPCHEPLAKKYKVTSIRCLYRDAGGQIWVGTNKGLFAARHEETGAGISFYERDIFSSGINSNKTINAISQDKKGKLLVGTESNGLIILNTKDNSYTYCINDPKDQRTLRSNYVYCILSDRKDNLWVGSETGLNTYFPYKEKFYSYTSDYLDKKQQIGAVWGIYSEDSLLFLGTTKKLNILNLNKGTLIQIKGAGAKAERHYFCFLKQGDHLLVGTSDGLQQLVYRKGNYELSYVATKETSVLREKKVCSIVQYDADNLWLGTYDDGLFMWNLKKHTIRKYASGSGAKNQIANEVTNVIYKDKDGVFWFGTDNGFSRYVPEKDGFVNYFAAERDTNTVSKKYVYTFYDDGTNLWIGTYGGGLNRMNKRTGKFSVWNTEQGLPDDAIYGILPDNQNRLWMSTNAGVSCFDIPKNKFTNYTESDGLQSNEFDHWAFHRDRNGTIYFGGINGVSAIRADDIVRDSSISPLVITGITVLDKPWYSGRAIADLTEITLPYFENKISFEFSLLDFASSKKNNYRFMLEGLDKDFGVATERHQASYNNLAPGTYLFRVAGCNHDGAWNNAGKSIRIVIFPPFYETWWFRSAVALALLLIIYAIYRYRINQLLELQAVRNRIARDLHDDIGATLGSISLYSEVAKKRMGKPGGNTEEVLNKIGASSREMIDKMSDIVWSVNPENDSLEHLLHRMKSFAALILGARGIAFIFEDTETDMGLQLNMQQRKNIYLIYKEAIYNSVKYAACSHIDILIRSKGRHFFLTVADNGCGFEIEKTIAFNGNGLKNMKARADEIRADFVIESYAGRGTTIKLRT